MPAEASIYSLIQQPKLTSPMEAYGGALQLKALVDQQALGDLQRKQLMDADQENQRIRDLFASGRTPTGAEVFAASPKTGLTYQKTLLENKKTQSEIDKNRIAGMKDTIDIFRNALGPVNDQASYAAWRSSLVKEIPQFGATVPEQFSVEAKRDLLLKGDELAKHLTPRSERVDVGGRIEVVDMNPITNPAIKGTKFDKSLTPGEVQAGAHQRATLAETQRHNAVNERNAALTAGVPSGFMRVQEGNLAPIPGGPADPNTVNARRQDNPTEDERKAAGWLAQATNAYNNMAKVMKDSPGAEGPGWGEALVSNLPVVGDAAARAIRPASRDSFMQAASSFSEAALRAATGAGVNKDEAIQKIRELTPLWTDNAATRQQKLDSMKVYLDSLAARAGRAVASTPIPPRAEMPKVAGAKSEINPKTLSDAELLRELGISR